MKVVPPAPQVFSYSPVYSWFTLCYTLEELNKIHNSHCQCEELFEKGCRMQRGKLEFVACFNWRWNRTSKTKTIIRSIANQQLASKREEAIDGNAKKEIESQSPRIDDGFESSATSQQPPVGPLPRYVKRGGCCRRPTSPCKAAIPACWLWSNKSADASRLPTSFTTWWVFTCRNCIFFISFYDVDCMFFFTWTYSLDCLLLSVVSSVSCRLG